VLGKSRKYNSLKLRDHGGAREKTSIKKGTEGSQYGLKGKGIGSILSWRGAGKEALEHKRGREAQKKKKGLTTRNLQRRVS